MKQLLSLILVIIALITSCTKDVGKKEEKFVAGDVLIGIRPEAELKTIFKAINAEKLKIKQMSGFYYHSPMPADSLKHLLNFLNTKSYIKSGNGFSAYAYFYEPEGAIRILNTYFDMSIPNQTDFLKLVDSLNWTNRVSERYIHLNVPANTEKFWLEEIKKYSFVTWTELNTIQEMTEWYN